MQRKYGVVVLSLILIGLLFRKIFLSSNTIAHISHTDQDSSTHGLIFLTEDTNVPNIRNRRKLQELLSPAEYRQALDSTQHYDKNYWGLDGSHLQTWRAKDYKVFDDSLLMGENYTAKLILIFDNTLGGGRQYFFQIRTYTKDNHLIDKAELASWSDKKKEFCSGWLTDDHFLIRSCGNNNEVKRINQSGHFIIPSPLTTMWLKVKGY